MYLCCTDDTRRLVANVSMDASDGGTVVVATSFQMAAFSMGGSLSYPTVLLQQFKANDSDIQPDLDTTTWIASIHGFAGIPSVLMPTFMQWKGRKYAFFVSCLLLTIRWVSTALARNAGTLIITETLSGLGSNCIVVVNFMTVSEMIAPKYRSTFMVLLSCNQMIGMFSSTLIGNFVHWKILAVIMSCPVILALLTIFIWPESPSWLAYKGNFDECEKAFVWLRGADEESMKELNALIAAQKEVRRHRKLQFTERLRIVLRKDFYIPIFLLILILSCFYVTGGVAWYMYSYNVIEMATGDLKLASIGYSLVNGLLLIGACNCMILLRKFNTKLIVLCTGFGAVFFHLCSSIVTYLSTVGVLSKGSFYFMLTFLAYFSFDLSGFNMISFALSTELIPVKHKGLGGAIFIISTCSLFTITTKSLPYLILLLNLWGTFLMCAIIGFVGLCLIWVYVPVTKNRTLQEIEDYYNYGTFVKYSDLDDINVSTPMVDDNVKE